MLSMILTWIGNLLGGPFAKAAVDAYRAKLTSENSAEKIAADLAAQQLTLDVERQKLEQAVVIADEGRWWTAAIRPLFAAPFVAFLWKVIILDRVLGWRTDDLLPWEVDLCKWIIASYFGHAALASLGRAVARR